mgnify:FL=1
MNIFRADDVTIEPVPDFITVKSVEYTDGRVSRIEYRSAEEILDLIQGQTMWNLFKSYHGITDDQDDRIVDD